jgi:superfamily II DNA helicase RecQ
VEAPHNSARLWPIHKRVMTQNSRSILTQIPAVQSILEKGKNNFPDPYSWQISTWEHMFNEKSRDVLVIARTGSGKSRIFQCLHFVKEDGVSLIVSPLVALMNDQVLRVILSTDAKI